MFSYTILRFGLMVLAILSVANATPLPADEAGLGCVADNSSLSVSNPIYFSQVNL